MRTFAAVVLAVSLVACGGVAGHVSPGTCPRAAIEDGLLTSHTPNLDDLFARTTWHAVTAIRHVRPAPRPPQFAGHYYPAEVVAEVVGVGVRREVRMQRRLVEAWRLVPDGATFWVPYDDTVWVAVETRRDGSVRWVGECADLTWGHAFFVRLSELRADGDIRTAAEVVIAAMHAE